MLEGKLVWSLRAAEVAENTVLWVAFPTLVGLKVCVRGWLDFHKASTCPAMELLTNVIFEHDIIAIVTKISAFACTISIAYLWSS